MKLGLKMLFMQEQHPNYIQFMKKVNTICIIDDDNIFTLVTKKIIEFVDSSENVQLFKNGKEALLAFQKSIDDEKPLSEIIFLDINMPLMGGFEFLDKLEKFAVSYNLCVYIFTSSINPEDQKRAQDYTVVRKFIEKPLTVEKMNWIMADADV